MRADRARSKIDGHGEYPLVAAHRRRDVGAAVEAVNLTELARGSTVWLAVTGLSRSGKTVFTTSLIHNLLSSLHNPNRMPLLNVVGERRLIAAKLEGAKANRLPRFPYAANIERMAGSPTGRSAPTDISEIGVDVHFVPAGTIGRLLSEISGNAATLTIRIVDYPGEWLLDLPLLAQSFAEWSRATVRSYRKGVRAELAPRLSRLPRPAPARRGGERGDRQAGARALSRVPWSRRATSTG